jgi:hypothetical protein
MRLLSIHCISGLSNFKLLRGRIIPWVEGSVIKIYFFKYRLTDTDIFPAIMRSMKQKQHTNKKWTHEVQNDLFELSVTRPGVLRNQVLKIC